MTDPTVYPSNLSWLGLARQTTDYTTAEATPTCWVPLISPAWKPGQTQLANEAMYGDMTRLHGVVAGKRSDVISYQTHIQLDTVYQHMLAILGTADAVTGTTDPYTHRTSVKNTTDGQPPPYTLWLYNGAECWRMVGCVLGKADINLPAEQLGSGSFEWTGLPATSIAAPSNTPSTTAPQPGWNTTTTVNGAQSTIYSDIKMSYARETSVIQTADGTQSPYRIFAGSFTAGLEFTGVYTGYSGSDLARLIGNTQVPVLVQSNPVGDATHYALWQHTLCAPGSEGVEVKSESGKYVEVSAKYEAIGNTTDATGTGTSPVQFKLLTAVSAAY